MPWRIPVIEVTTPRREVTSSTPLLMVSSKLLRSFKACLICLFVFGTVDHQSQLIFATRPLQFDLRLSASRSTRATSASGAGRAWTAPAAMATTAKMLENFMLMAGSWFVWNEGVLSECLVGLDCF